MKITRRVRVVLMVLLGMFSLTLSAYADQIADPSPVNLTDAAAIWDYRDTGRPQDTGAYFNVYVAVVPKAGSPLPDDNAVASAVREVKVKHLQTGREFTAGTDPCLNFVGIGQYYDVFLQPEDWVFEGTWEITMIYQDTDKRLHTQTLSDVPSGPRIFPPVPTGIEITPSGNYVSVSWDGAGDLRQMGGNASYRLRIYDPDGFCASDYSWLYQTSPGSPSRVVSNPNGPYPITSNLIGRTLRLENRWYQAVPGNPNAFARAVKFLTLDYTPPEQ